VKQNRPEQRHPQLVSGLAQVQAVSCVELGAGQAVRPEHGRGDIDETEAPIRRTVGLDQRIRPSRLGPELPALGAGLDGEEDDAGIREAVEHRFGKPLPVSEHALGALAVGDVVVAGVKDDSLGAMREHDPLDERDAVGDVRGSRAGCSTSR